MLLLLDNFVPETLTIGTNEMRCRLRHAYSGHEDKSELGSQILVRRRASPHLLPTTIALIHWKSCSRHEDASNSGTFLLVRNPRRAACADYSYTRHDLQTERKTATSSSLLTRLTA